MSYPTDETPKPRLSITLPKAIPPSRPATGSLPGVKQRRRTTPTAAERKELARSAAISDAVLDPPKADDTAVRMVRLPNSWWALFDAKAKELKTPPRKLARRIYAAFLYPQDAETMTITPRSATAQRHDQPQPIRPEKGTAEWRSNCYWARISIPGQGRPRIKLKDAHGRILNRFEEDRELANEITAELSLAAREKASVTAPHRTTVREFGRLYTSGQLLKRHGPVRNLKDKASMKSDANRLERLVYPHIGDMAVADVREEDVERCFATAIALAEAKRGEPWRAATKIHFYQVLHRLFDLAIRPGRLREDNPVSRDLKVRKDPSKLYAFLRPDELVKLIGCERVPLVRRVYYALAVYTGLRKDSLKAFTWKAIDFKEQTVLSTKQKNGTPLYFAQYDHGTDHRQGLPGLSSLLVILERYRALLGNPRPDSLIIEETKSRGGHEAEVLREDLQTAGVTREILFMRAANIEPLRFHDLRATFVTWAFRAGKHEGWISERTGHMSQEMLARYRRGASTIQDLTIEPFPDISEAIPELRGEMLDTNVIRFPGR